MATRKKKIIKLPQGKPQALAKALGCSLSSVYDALGYMSESEQAQLIREKALKEYGGIITHKIVFADH